MGIKAAKIQKLVNTALTKQLGDLAESATYISISSTYNPATSETTETRTSVTARGTVFYSKKDSLSLYSRLAARGSVDLVEANLPSFSAVVPGVQLAGVTPKNNDILKRGSTEYTIERISIDPVGAAYIFGLRLP
jgi:hypothetical protein